MRANLAIALASSFLLLVALGPARAQTAAPAASVEKARLLYACFHFANEGSKGAAPPQQEQLRRIAMKFLALATQEVVAADPDKNPLNTQLATQTSAEGKADFVGMITEASKLPTADETNARIGQFANSCTKAMN